MMATRIKKPPVPGATARLSDVLTHNQIARLITVAAARAMTISEVVYEMVHKELPQWEARK